MSEQMERSGKVKIICSQCANSYTIFVEPESFERWCQGEGPIQDIMPYLSVNEAELLVSGVCGACFDRATKEDDDDGSGELVGAS